MDIFTVRWNVVSKISKVLMNDIFAKFDGSRNNMTDTVSGRLDLSGLQVERCISKNYTSQVNQALSRCFLSVSSENLGRAVSTIFQVSIMYMHVLAAVWFYEFQFKFKKENS